MGEVNLIIRGDCLDILRGMEPESVDSLVTDPPAGISFMGKAWDKSHGFIPSMTEIFKECLKVLKPGAHGFVWAIPRTSHWTATALEDAGFEIRDVVTHLFGSGFPKSSALNRQKSGVFCQCALNKHSSAHTSDVQQTADHNNNLADVCDDDPLHVNDLHSTDKLLNSQGDYPKCHDSNDERAHHASTTALGAFQPQQYAQERSRSVEPLDVAASESSDNLSSVQYKNLHANKDCSFLSSSQKDVFSDKSSNTKEWENKPIQKDSAILADRKQHISSQSSYGTALPNCGHCGKPNVDGWYNGGLKPASEHWILVRKPCSEKTVAANVLKHGTGGINIDASRIQLPSDDPQVLLRAGKTLHAQGKSEDIGATYSDGVGRFEGSYFNNKGRFPANLILSHNPDCVEVGSKKVVATSGKVSKSGLTKSVARSWKNTSVEGINRTRFGSEDGTETLAAFECTPDCAVAAVDEQSGVLKSGGSGGIRKNGGGWKQTSEFIKPNNLMQPDSGGASRFFLCVKHDIDDESCGSEKTKAGNTFAGKKMENKSVVLNTDGSGNNSSDQYMMDSMSIIRTEIVLTMSFQILNASIKTPIGHCIIKTEKIIELFLAENVVGVSIVSNTEALIYLENGQQVPIKGTVEIVPVKNFGNGENKTKNITTPITENIELSGARFRYCAKTSKSERNAGCEDLYPKKSDYRPNDSEANTLRERLRNSILKANHHPTVKPKKLMSYLINMITPKNGLVLDPFAGSGSTGVAAIENGFQFIGIEKEDEYATIAESRIQHALNSVLK